MTVMISSIFSAFLSDAYGVDLNFNGELVTFPCEVIEGTPEDVVFYTRSAKYFHYEPATTPTQPFKISLQCDTSITAWNVVRVKFDGQPEPGMGEFSNQFIKVDGVNTGFLAVGLYDTDGSTPIELGEETIAESIVSRDRVDLNFSAFVKATPSALANKDVIPGDYRAVATFELFYE